MLKKLLLFLSSLVLFFFPFSAFADQTIVVSASVPPKASDFQLALSANPNAATTLNQFQHITYTITYGSHLVYTTPMTITASWDQGTITGQSSPTVDIADYVVGSATNAYNNTSPIVDTVNKTITWTINALPANIANQTVRFTLQPNDSYTGQQTVTFPTTTHLAANNVTTSDQSIIMTYQYNPAITPSPTLTPIPIFTPTPTQPGPTATLIPQSQKITFPIITISPTPIPSLAITNVTVETISPSDAGIHITTNQSARISLQYGTSLNALSQTSGEQTGTDVTIKPSNLIPNMTYYFRVTATADGLTTATSEIFTFKTASAGSITNVNKSSVIVTSGTTILYDVIENANSQLDGTIVVPINVPFQFTFSLAGRKNIKNVEAFIQNNKVLAANTFDQSAPTNNVKLFEIQPDVYQGILTSTNFPGAYGLYIRVYETTGNITQQQLFPVKVLQPFTILNQETKKPVENAEVTLYRQDLTTHKFAKITQQMINIKNPSFSNAQGQIVYVLPQGTYQASIDALGYDQKVVTFKIGASRDEDYPLIYIRQSGLSIGSISHFTKATWTDIAQATTTYFATLGGSNQLSSIASIFVGILCVILCLVSLSARIYIPIYFFPWYIWYSSKQLLVRNSNENSRLRIIDEETNIHLGKATVTIIDAEKNSIITTIHTNPAGETSFTLTDCKMYNVAVHKDGYEGHPFFGFTRESLQYGKVLLPIRKEQTKKHAEQKLLQILLSFIASCFEIILLLTIILEVIFGIYLGWSTILLFLILSMINTCIFIIYLQNKRH